MKYKLSPRTLSILKYLFAFTLLGIVLNKVGFDEISKHLKEISIGEGLIAVALASAANVLSALRMRYFFQAAMFKMSRYFAVVLFYVGAFYNFLLPGGIGGDAYKVLIVHKRMDIAAMKGIRIMVADRASGLCAIMFTMFIALYLMGFTHLVPYGGMLLFGAVIITPIAYVMGSKLLLRQHAVDMVGSLRYSILVQVFWVATLAMIWRSIGHNENLLAYVALYCAAGIASMIPISVGGLGVREMTYFYGAQQMQHWMGIDVNPELGVAISLCLFFLTIVCALPGLFWLNKTSKIEINGKKMSAAEHASFADTRGGGGSREDWN